MVENLVFSGILHQEKAVGWRLVQTGWRMEERLDGSWFLPGNSMEGSWGPPGQMLVAKNCRSENKIMFHGCFTQ